VRPFLCRHNAKHDVPRLRPVSLQFPYPVAIQQQNCTYPDIQGYSQLAKAVSMAIMALAEYTLAKQPLCRMAVLGLQRTVVPPVFRFFSGRWQGAA
jgi:hypothetical protein